MARGFLAGGGRHFSRGFLLPAPRNVEFDDDGGEGDFYEQEMSLPSFNHGRGICT